MSLTYAPVQSPAFVDNVKRDRGRKVARRSRHAKRRLV
jgi:hypothetical protein